MDLELPLQFYRLDYEGCVYSTPLGCLLKPNSKVFPFFVP